MKKPRRRIQKARRRAEKLATRAARIQKKLDRSIVVSVGSIVSRRANTNEVTFHDAADAREVFGVVTEVIDTETCVVVQRFTPYQRAILDWLRSAGQVVVEVESRHAITTPCDYDATDDTKGALNVHAAATGGSQ